MSSLIYFFFGFLVGGILVFIFYRPSREATLEKNQNKKKILSLFKSRTELSNSDIQDSLGFSDRSVVRYMDELEAEGKVEQVGDIGRGVIYRLKR